MMISSVLLITMYRVLGALILLVESKCVIQTEEIPFVTIIFQTLKLMLSEVPLERW